MSLCEKCEPRNLEAMRALESLTPNGSEFVNEPKRCVEHVRQSQASQMRAIVAFKKRANAAEAEVARLREALRKYGHHSFGCPITMTGASDCYCGLEAALAEAALRKEQNG